MFVVNNPHASIAFDSFTDKSSKKGAKRWIEAILDQDSEVLTHNNMEIKMDTQQNLLGPFWIM